MEWNNWLRNPLTFYRFRGHNVNLAEYTICCGYSHSIALLNIKKLNEDDQHRWQEKILLLWLELQEPFASALVQRGKLLPAKDSPKYKLRVTANALDERWQQGGAIHKIMGKGSHKAMKARSFAIVLEQSSIGFRMIQVVWICMDRNLGQ